MKSYHYSLILLLFSIVSFLAFAKNIKLRKDINKLNTIVLHKEQSIKQLKFNLGYLDVVTTNFSLYPKSISKRYDTLMYYYFSDSACMYCVNFELASNIKDTPIKVIANIISDRKYKNLSRTYNQFNIIRDTVMELRHRKPFYIVVVISNKITDIFEPDIKKNYYTKAFLMKYGVKKLTRANNEN